MPLTYEVIRHVPDRAVVLAATSGLLRSTDRIVVTGSGDGARVGYDAEVRLRGPLRVLDPVMRQGFHAVAGRATAGLARVLSTGPASSGEPARPANQVTPAEPTPPQEASP
jgi:hypothetical protein